MTENVSERQIIIRSRMAEGYHLSEVGLKGMQHVFTDWFPRAVYADLTDDTVSIDVVARKDFTSGKSLLTASFKRTDGSAIKSAEYGEERLVGKACQYYDPKKSRYDGKKDGFDQRIVFYAASRPK
jgi:hypothetical protein